MGKQQGSKAHLSGVFPELSEVWKRRDNVCKVEMVEVATKCIRGGPCQKIIGCQTRCVWVHFTDVSEALLGPAVF